MKYLTTYFNFVGLCFLSFLTIASHTSTSTENLEDNIKSFQSMIEKNEITKLINDDTIKHEQHRQKSEGSLRFLQKKNQCYQSLIKFLDWYQQEKDTEKKQAYIKAYTENNPECIIFLQILIKEEEKLHTNNLGGWILRSDPMGINRNRERKQAMELHQAKRAQQQIPQDQQKKAEEHTEK